MQNDIKKSNPVETLRTTSLRVGQVNFINCLPINLPISLGEVEMNTNIIPAVPSELNRMILSGEIDIAPVSSIAYLENKDKLSPFADLCIASNGPADSVLLFSHFPIEELDESSVLLSKASATSNKLLQVIFKEFLKINVDFHFDPKIKSPAYLLIGDEALLEYSRMPRNVFIYDLGSLWKKHTGLPMVFGLWVKRKDIENASELSIIEDSLKKAKEIGLTKSFDKVVKKAQEKILISKEFYTGYFEHLSYDFTIDYKKGLDAFEELTITNKLLSSV